MDSIFYNGQIHTLESDERKEALGIENGRIAFIGTDKEAEGLQAKERIDLKGKTVLPGFTDGHMHLANYAFSESAIRLADCNSVEAALKKVADQYCSGGKKADYLYCSGWNEENFKTKRYPLRAELDEISGEIPITFERICGHVAVCNTAALLRMQQLPDFSALQGEVDLESGLVKEGAVYLFYRIMDKPSKQKICELLSFGMRKLNEAGITGCQCDDFSGIPGAGWRDILCAYEDLEKKNEMTVRIYEQCLFEQIAAFREFLAAGHRTGQGGEYFKIGPLKLLQDGSLGARTAALSEPYLNSDNLGISIFSKEELEAIIGLAHENKMQIAVHCIGDRAMDMTVEAIQKAQKKWPREDCRHGIVHAQITTKKILKKMAENKILAYIQPVFVGTDMDMVEERIGAERTQDTYAWNTMKKMGIITVGGSDAPVESFSVMENIYFAVTRKNMQGEPEEGWMPQEKVSVEEAIKMFTVYPAYASFSEKYSGTLAVGKYGDFVVLDENIYEVKPERIKDIKICRTVIAGKTVYAGLEEGSENEATD